MSRVLLAFLVAPLTPGLIAAAFLQEPQALVAFSMFSYPLALGLGLPAYLLLRHWRWLKPGRVVVASSALGVLLFCAIWIFDTRPPALMLLLIVACCALVGAAFSLIIYSGSHAHGPQSSN